MSKHINIMLLVFALAVAAQTAFAQNPPSSGQARPDPSLVDFTAAADVLREILQLIGRPIIDESSPNPVSHLLVAPREIRIRASFQLSRQAGRPSFILVRPTDASMISLEIEATFDVATGSLRVSEAKKLLTGKEAK